MSTQFNIRRFFKLFINDYRTNYKKNLLFMASLFVLMVLYFSFFRTMEDSIEMEGTFILLMVAFWVIQGAYTCMTFGEFSSRKRTQQLLSIPSMHAEVFWSKFLISFVVFPIVFCLYGLLVLKLNIDYNHWHASHFDVSHIRYNTLSEFWFSNGFFGEGGTVFQSFAFVSAFISTCFLWGAMTFRKYAFLKTVVSWFLLLFAMWPLTILVYFIVSGTYTPACIPFIVMGEYPSVSLFEYYPDLIWYIASFVCLSLIVISRIKFNEKTI